MQCWLAASAVVTVFMENGVPFSCSSSFPHFHPLSPANLPTLQNEARSEAMFGQILDRAFKDEAAEKMMAMIDE